MAQISTKIEILNDLKSIIKRTCNIANVDIMATDQAGLSANIKPDSWIPSGPSRQGFTFRVLVEIKDDMDKWASITQKTDDFCSQIESDCDWKVNDNKTILSSEYESATRIEDDTELKYEIAVLVYDARLSPVRG
jgi:hypothetical protein